MHKYQGITWDKTVKPNRTKQAKWMNIGRRNEIYGDVVRVKKGYCSIMYKKYICRSSVVRLLPLIRFSFLFLTFNPHSHSLNMLIPTANSTSAFVYKQENLVRSMTHIFCCCCCWSHSFLLYLYGVMWIMRE